MILNPLLFYIKVVQMMVKKKNQHQKTWVGGGGRGEINRPGQVAPHSGTNFFSIFLTLKTRF